ncbi:hypothetical protein SeMB42_g04125 [Synchytrium endobioticum]|uniref:Uncharacterized protein n=1 Tax=Synchytrium endobioticum TaxID=286115 RepID=A0A507D0R9_9FUNG|nr:hypothetical protein SeLEV6574_g06717 [Synchytrium endobioticum]TPX45064.1 hypothetical protein SeMB42_g04125 [Synchytrium endobioticum]
MGFLHIPPTTLDGCVCRIKMVRHTSIMTIAVVAAMFVVTLASPPPAVLDKVAMDQLIKNMSNKAGYAKRRPCTKTRIIEALQVNTKPELLISVITPGCTYTFKDLMSSPNRDSMDDFQIRFTRAYHSCVFHWLRSILTEVQTFMIGTENDERKHVIVHKLEEALTEHSDLSKQYGKVRKHQCRVSPLEPPGLDRHINRIAEDQMELEAHTASKITSESNAQFTGLAVDVEDLLCADLTDRYQQEPLPCNAASTDDADAEAPKYHKHMELLDLFSTDISAEENDSPRMIDFLGQAEDKALPALELSLGVPSYVHSFWESSHTYNHRANGKRPMDDHASADTHSTGHGDRDRRFSGPSGTKTMKKYL